MVIEFLNIDEDGAEDNVVALAEALDGIEHNMFQAIDRSAPAENDGIKLFPQHAHRASHECSDAMGHYSHGCH